MPDTPPVIVFQPGDRVAVIAHPADSSGLEPGQAGTIAAPATGQTGYTVDWDHGIRTVINADLVEPLARAERWQATRSSLIAHARRSGAAAAARWLTTTPARPATADTDQGMRDAAEVSPAGEPTGPRPAAARAAIHDQDADLLAALPLPSHTDASTADPRSPHHPEGPQWYAAAAGGDGMAWPELTADRQDAADRLYADTFDATLVDEIARARWLPALPAGDGDLAHLAPEPVIGRVGVFTGSWLHRDSDEPGPDRYTEGYIGTLIGLPSAGGVFECDRAVAAAIADRVQQLPASGLPALSWDGDVLLVDARTREEPDAITRIHPAGQRRYALPDWGWDMVDPLLCDALIGTIPGPEGQPEFVPLQHVPGPIRTPDERLRVLPWRETHSEATPSLRSSESLAHTLAFDGQPLGEVWLFAHGPMIDWRDEASFSPDDVEAYAARCSDADGQPLTGEQLVEYLLMESAFAGDLAGLADGGATLMRQLRPGRRPIDVLRVVWPAPRTALAIQRLGWIVASGEPEGRWELWTDRGWLDVTPTTGGTPGDEPRGEWPDWLQVAPGDLPDLDSLDRDALIAVAAEHGVALTRALSDTAIRARITTVLLAGPGAEDSPR